EARPCDRRQQVVRVVVEVDRPAERVGDGLNLRPRVVDVGDGDVVAVGVPDKGRVDRPRSRRAVLDERAVGVTGLRVGDRPGGVGLGAVIYEGAVYGVERGEGAEAVNLGRRAGEAVAGAV